MASYISPGPLCDSCKFCTIQERPDRHSRQFKAISISPVTGIVFKAYEYSAIQLADAFDNIISGYMDFEIKKQALERWNVLRQELFDGPWWRDTEFDLQDIFFALDDFLFLRALRDSCRVEWVDERMTGWHQHRLGWCEMAEVTNRGPTQWIRLVRPTVDRNRSIQEILGILMHEMCHAIFAFRCGCYCCRCPLNQINSDGLSGHGPSWDKLRRSVENTANLHLLRFEPIQLCSYAELEFEEERQKVGRMLSGLYKKIAKQGSESAELKRMERAKKLIEQTAMFANIEKEDTEERRLDIIASAGDMLRQFERARVSSALEKHVACPSALVQRSGPGRLFPRLGEALAEVDTETLHKHKDGVGEIHSKYNQDGGESDQRGPGEGRSH